MHRGEVPESKFLEEFAKSTTAVSRFKNRLTTWHRQKTNPSGGHYEKLSAKPEFRGAHEK